MEQERLQRYMQVHLCLKHLEPYDISPDRRGYRQLCPDCPRAAKQPQWEHTDFNAWVGICECCTGNYVLSGSKWSKFFCSECQEVMNAYEAESYRPLDIPVGRHSLMNGVALKASDLDNPDAVAAFWKEFDDLQERIARLRQWRRQRLALFVADQEDDIPVEAVFRAVARAWDSEQAFIDLWRWWVDIDVEEDADAS